MYTCTLATGRICKIDMVLRYYEAIKNKEWWFFMPFACFS